MAFEIGITTIVGQIRLEIGDNVLLKGVKPEGANFTDEELTHFYTVEGGDASIDPVQTQIGRASAKACETLAIIYAKEATMTKMGPTSDRWDTSKFYSDMGKRLRQQYGGNHIDGRMRTRIPLPSGTARAIIVPFGA